MDLERFIEASKLVTENNTYCCTALYHIDPLGHYFSQHYHYFNKLFRPDHISKNEITNWFGDNNNTTNQLARSLALLLTAEVLKDEQEETICIQG